MKFSKKASKGEAKYTSYSVESSFKLNCAPEM